MFPHRTKVVHKLITNRFTHYNFQQIQHLTALQSCNENSVLWHLKLRSLHFSKIKLVYIIQFAQSMNQISKRSICKECKVSSS